jgi:hypothetical protein
VLLLLLLLLWPCVCLHAQALPIALQHPLISSDSGMLCAAAQACKGWREAVQQCGARNTCITLDLMMPLSQMHSFAQWLHKHAALVNSIEAKLGCLPDDVDGLPTALHVDEAQRVLHRALQLAGTMPAPPTAAVSSTTAAVAASVGSSTGAEQQQQQGWRLARFSSYMPGAELLAALPTHSLTHLELDDGGCSGCSTVSTEDDSTTAAALARLSSLQRLRLAAWTNGIPVSALAGVAQLSRLTALSLYGNFEGIKQPLEQLLAQQLPLRKLEMSMHESTRNSSQPVLDIEHLTTLEQLSNCWWSLRGQLPEGSALPAQLKQLQVAQCSARDLAAVMPLQQLQGLDLIIDTDTAGEVARLAQLPALQHLALGYTTLRLAAATAHVWQQLLQLQELRVAGHDDEGTILQMQLILEGIAAATSLTNLHLESSTLVDEQMTFCDLADIVVCPKWLGCHACKHCT